MQGQIARAVCQHCLIQVAVYAVFVLLAQILFHNGKIIYAYDHILSRNHNGASVRRLKNVVGSQHQIARLCLSLLGKRHMHRHLVAVKVRVEGGTHKRVELYGSSVHQHRLKGLYAQAVQSRRTV